MTRVGLIPHRDKDSRANSRARGGVVAGAHGAAVELAKPDADRIGRPELGDRPATFPDGLDVVISLGGDGSMLRAIDQSYDAGVAVLGVNVGQMGYLTEVEPADLDVALARLSAATTGSTSAWCSQSRVESAGPAAATGTDSTRRAREDAHRSTWRGSRSTSTGRSSPRTRPTA
jgi:hypothetical protein